MGSFLAAAGVVGEVACPSDEGENKISFLIFVVLFHLTSSLFPLQLFSPPRQGDQQGGGGDWWQACRRLRHRPRRRLRRQEVLLEVISVTVTSKSNLLFLILIICRVDDLLLSPHRGSSSDHLAPLALTSLT